MPDSVSGLIYESRVLLLRHPLDLLGPDCLLLCWLATLCRRLLFGVKPPAVYLVLLWGQLLSAPCPVLGGWCPRSVSLTWTLSDGFLMCFGFSVELPP